MATKTDQTETDVAIVTVNPPTTTPTPRLTAATVEIRGSHFAAVNIGGEVKRISSTPRRNAGQALKDAENYVAKLPKGEGRSTK